MSRNKGESDSKNFVSCIFYIVLEVDNKELKNTSCCMHCYHSSLLWGAIVNGCEKEESSLQCDLPSVYMLTVPVAAMPTLRSDEDVLT